MGQWAACAAEFGAALFSPGAMERFYKALLKI